MKSYGAASPVYYGKAIEDGEYLEAPVVKALPLTRLAWTFIDYIFAAVLLLVPWLVFVGVCAMLSFDFHLKYPTLCWILVGVLGFLTVLTIIFALYEYCGKVGRSAVWAVSLAVSMCLAFTLGMMVGQSNYSSFMLPYYTWMNLNSYQAVNPAQMGGLAFMDAGRVSFSSNSKLDLKKAAGFLNSDMYCVTPIVSSDGKSDRQAYDFWAVGTNCCSGSYADFHCGAYDMNGAVGGLRVLPETDRDFYKLAVDQAAANFNLQVKHPVFFHWVQDANLAVEEYKEQGIRNFGISVFVYFFFQVLLVLISFLLVAVLCRPQYSKGDGL